MRKAALPARRAAHDPAVPAPLPLKGTDVDSVADLTRMPPQNLEAEQAVLGGMMLSPDAAMDVMEEHLEARDFYRPAHETIYSAAVGLYAAGEPCDPIMMASKLEAEGTLAKVGGPGYLHHLVQQVPTAANAAYYAEIVRNKARLRRIITACERIIQGAYATEGIELEEFVQDAEREFFAAAEAKDTSEDYVFAKDVVPEFITAVEERSQHKDELVGISTGIADLDDLTGGLRPGQMITIAARPAQGKSALTTNFLMHCAIQQNLPGVLFSLEMGRDEIMERIFSAGARVGLHHLRSGEVTDEDWVRIGRFAPKVAQSPMILDDSVNLSMLDIMTKSRRIKERHGLSFIAVDYMQLMQFGGKRQGSRQEEVSAISRGLKLLGKELQVPVVALSQLNRNAEAREDHKPMVSDLRESGSIEQDSDMIILLHRPDAYEKESPRAGEADLIVGKHRGGPTATITAAFQGHYSRFVDMANEGNF